MRKTKRETSLVQMRTRQPKVEELQRCVERGQAPKAPSARHIPGVLPPEASKSASEPSKSPSASFQVLGVGGLRVGQRLVLVRGVHGGGVQVT